MEEPIQYIQFLLCLLMFNWNSFASATGTELDDINDIAEFKIEGKVFFSSKDKEWTMNTKVLVDGGNYLGFVKSDGSFAVNGIPSGSYVVEVANPDAFFETMRIEITSKGKMRARRINLLQPTHVKTVPYPLEFKERGKINYFHKREQWRLTDFLFNPMVLTMIVPLLLIMVLPKLMNAADVDTQKVVQERRSYDEENNYSVTNKSVAPYSSVSHGSELLQLSQKPHKSATSAAFFGDHSENKNSKFIFQLKDSHDLTQCQGTSTNNDMQTNEHASVKEITFDNSFKTCGNGDNNIETSCQENQKYVKDDNVPTERFTISQPVSRVDIGTPTSSPKLISLQQTGESPVNSSAAHTDLVLEMNNRKYKTENHDSGVFKESVSNYNRNKNVSDEPPIAQGVDTGQGQEMVQSVVSLSEIGSQASMDNQENSQLYKHEEPSVFLSRNQSRDNETAVNITDSDDTRTENSITLTEEGLLNFSLSDENDLAEVTDLPPAKSSSLELSSSPKRNDSCCAVATPQPEPHDQPYMNKSSTKSELTLSVASVSGVMTPQSPTEKIMKPS